MITRKEAIEYGLSFPNTYVDAPFRDPNWQLIRVKESKKVFLWIRWICSVKCKSRTRMERFLERSIPIGHSGISSK